MREQILAGDANVGCRQWRGAHPEAVVPFVTDNRRYRLDIDTEDDLAAFQRDTGHRLAWPAGVVAAA